jgi:NADPH:quinone reductase-like Zn-dependent oxidoreductase
MSLIFTGKLKPVLDRDFPLAQAAAAQEYLETGNYKGKVTLSIGE